MAIMSFFSSYFSLTSQAKIKEKIEMYTISLHMHKRLHIFLLCVVRYGAIPLASVTLHRLYTQRVTSLGRLYVPLFEKLPPNFFIFA